MGLFFWSPTTTQATEMTQQVKAQEVKMKALEDQVTKVETEQDTIQAKFNSFVLDKTILEQDLEKITRDKAAVEAQVKAEDTRLRVVDTIQGYLIGVGSNGMEVISVKDQERKIERLKESVLILESKIEDKETEIAQKETEHEKDVTQKSRLADESEKLAANLAKETQKLTALKEQQAAEEAEKKRLEATGFLTPLNIPLNVSSPFGYRADPTGYSGNGHDGIDFTGNYGDAILAARYGRVVEAGSHWSAGNYAIIQHDNGYYSYYMHMTEVYVSVGQSVGTLEQIGTMGTTGNSTGVHLHFGLATGIWNGFVNPANFIM